MKYLLLALLCSSASVYARTGDLGYDYEVENQLKQVQKERQPSSEKENKKEMRKKYEWYMKHHHPQLKPGSEQKKQHP